MFSSWHRFRQMADETLAAPGASGKEAAHPVDCGIGDEDKTWSAD